MGKITKIRNNNLILTVTRHLIGHKKCLCHNKTGVKNVSIRTTLYLNFEHFNVISKVNSSYLLYIIAEN